MPEMTIEMAREIIRQSEKYEAWSPDIEGQTPDNIPEAQAFEQAQKMLEYIQNAYKRQIRSDAVIDILFAGQVEPAEYPEVYTNGRQPPAQEQPSPDSAPPGDPKKSAFDPVSQSVDIEKIVPNYDKFDLKGLIAAIESSAASGDLAPEEWEQIKAYEAAHEERKSILTLEPQFKQPESESAPAPEPRQVGEPSRAPDSQPTAPPDYSDIRGLKQSYDAGRLGQDQISAEALPIPLTPSGQEPVLPIDITALSPDELANLIMQFHSLYARELWLVSQEDGRADAAVHLQSEAYRDAYAQAFSRIRSGLEKETATALEGARSEAKHEADADATVVAWRNRAVRHRIEVRSLKALADTHKAAADRLAGEQSRRQTEIRAAMR